MNIPSRDKTILKTIYQYSRRKKVALYIVGGYLRDIVLKRTKENPDIDFSLKSGAISFGRALAKKIFAGFVVLDKDCGACRLVRKIGNRTYTLDFTDFRGKDIEDDLLHRDFTINSMALEMGSNRLIDSYGAGRDLKAKVIRMVNKKAFDEDPLRMLRAFSFACLLRFKIDPPILNLIKPKKNKLKTVSFERIRDELFKILDTPLSSDYLKKMDGLNILKLVIPEIKAMYGVYQGPYHHLDVWKHSLETVRQMDIIVGKVKNGSDMQKYLDEVISQERRRRALLKLAALLHDAGKPKALRRRQGKIIFHGHERIGSDIADGVAKRLKLSNDEKDILKKIVFFHLRPGYLADNARLTARAKFRYFRDAGKEAVGVLLVSLSDQRATRGRLTTAESRRKHEELVCALTREYFKKQKEKKLVRLISGDDLIREFNLSPSPLIGKILGEVEELQAIGKVKTKEEALKVAREIIEST